MPIITIVNHNDTTIEIQQQDPPGPTLPIHTVSFSPDGHQLLSGGDDATLRLWDVRTGARRWA